MVSIINNTQEGNEIPRQEGKERPHVNFYESREGEDPFPDPNILGSMDSDQQGEVTASVN